MFVIWSLINTITIYKYVNKIIKAHADINIQTIFFYKSYSSKKYNSTYISYIYMYLPIELREEL